MRPAAKRISIRELERRGAIKEIQDGNHGELHPKASDYVDDGIPFIMANNFIGNTVDVGATQKIPEPLAENLRIGFARDGDVLLTHKGTIGNTAIVNGANPYWMLTPQVTYYRTDATQLDNRYLMYAFQEPVFHAIMKSRADQATRPYIGILAQRDLQILYRPIEEQKRVVEILGPYDGLIENNRRRIDLLEQSVRLLFKEWFVRLRYPGHEHDKIVGGVPKGWTTPSFTELAEFINGYAFKPHHWEEIGLPIIKIPELKEGVRQKTPRYSGSDVPDRLKVHFGDLLFSWSGTLAIEFWADEDSYLNQHLFLVKPRGKPGAAFLLLALREALPKFANLSVGATMKHIRRSALEQTRALVPGSALLSEFEEQVDVIYSLVVNLRKQNTELARARDLLLPRLMDGRLSV
jgi:type I restriction enzyme, S subunit